MNVCDVMKDNNVLCCVDMYLYTCMYLYKIKLAIVKDRNDYQILVKSLNQPHTSFTSILISVLSFNGCVLF